MAAVLVDAGRVVPALERDGTGQLRARWWPLPAAADRPWLEAMLPADDLASQRQLAEALAAAVDRCVRQRLLHGDRSGSSPSQRCFGLPEAWLTALASDDSLLANTTDPTAASTPNPTTASAPLADAETALLQGLAAWVRQGVAASGELQLCLRCHEPPDARRRRWLVELLLRPAADPSLLVPLAAFWAGDSPFAASAFEAVLGQLGLLTRLAPELAPLLEQEAPASLELDEAGLVQLVTQRSSLLAEAGFAMLLPSGLRQGQRLAMRARALAAPTGKRGKAAPAGGGAGLDLTRMFSFEWQAVLGDRPLSAAELASLERAAALKRPLVRLRGQWSLVDGAAVAGLLRLAGQQAEASGADLLRSALGLGQLDLPPELELAGVEASGPLGTLLAGDLHQRAEAMATPEAFRGELRPYQQRALPGGRHGPGQNRPADRLPAGRSPPETHLGGGAGDLAGQLAAGAGAFCAHLECGAALRPPAAPHSSNAAAGDQGARPRWRAAHQLWRAQPRCRRLGPAVLGPAGV
jgi:hypothetical protein